MFGYLNGLLLLMFGLSHESETKGLVPRLYAEKVYCKFLLEDGKGWMIQPLYNCRFKKEGLKGETYSRLKALTIKAPYPSVGKNINGLESK